MQLLVALPEILIAESINILKVAEKHLNNVQKRVVVELLRRKEDF